jgi:hypothetical protein
VVKVVHQRPCEKNYALYLGTEVVLVMPQDKIMQHKASSNVIRLGITIVNKQVKTELCVGKRL